MGEHAQPPITLQIKEEIAQALTSSDPATNVFVQYLEWRRDLDPARFDRWHPIEGPILARVTPSTATPDPVINPQPQTIPPAVPEPGSLTLSLALVGAGLGAPSVAARSSGLSFHRIPRNKGSHSSRCAASSPEQAGAFFARVPPSASLNTKR